MRSAGLLPRFRSRARSSMRPLPPRPVVRKFESAATAAHSIYYLRAPRIFSTALTSASASASVPTVMRR